MWQVLDIRAREERWVERRALSDRFLSLWAAAEGGATHAAAAEDEAAPVGG